MEGFKFEPVVTRNDEEAQEKEITLFREKIEQGQGVDFSPFLGEGFDGEYFADKLKFFQNKEEAFNSWNKFLEEDEGGKYQNRQIEIKLFETIIARIFGVNNGPMLFPTVIKSLQDYGKSKNIPTDHITPESMERFYNSTIGI